MLLIAESLSNWVTYALYFREISSELVAQSEHETLPVQNIFRAYDDIRNNQLLRESVATTATGTNQLREENQDTADLDVRTPQRLHDLWLDTLHSYLFTGGFLNPTEMKGLWYGTRSTPSSW